LIPALCQREQTCATLEEVERRHIFETLASVNQDKARAANILGIDLSTLYRKLKRYDAV
jgi:two-component system response regulator AtoC